MHTSASPIEVVEALLARSICAVQCAAVLADKKGIHSWGWNSSGPDGYGMHAEAHCFSRTNRKRLKQSTLYVAAQWKKRGNLATAKPCEQCMKLAAQCMTTMYRDKHGKWRTL